MRREVHEKYAGTTSEQLPHDLDTLAVELQLVEEGERVQRDDRDRDVGRRLRRDDVADREHAAQYSRPALCVLRVTGPYNRGRWMLPARFLAETGSACG